MKDKLELKIFGDEVLREKTENVTVFDDDFKDLIKKMYKVMIKNKGIGLAAPQVGISKRFFIVDIEQKKDSMIMVANPEVIYSSEDQEAMEEGCLSVPGIWANVTRAHSIVMKGKNINGEDIQITAEGLFARALLHEKDHLDGILFVDKIDDKDKAKISSDLEKLENRKKA